MKLIEAFQCFSFTEAEMAKIADIPQSRLSEMRNSGLARKGFAPSDNETYTFVNVYEIYNNLPDNADREPGSTTFRKIPSDWLNRAEAIMASKVGHNDAKEMREAYETAIPEALERAQTAKSAVIQIP